MTMKNESVEAELRAGRRLARCKPGDEVVITGIAGTYPASDNVRHFSENLYAKKDLTSDDDRRGKLNHPKFPERTGILNEVNKFDATFFGIHHAHAEEMDPSARILLEKTYEAIVDSGYNPKQLRESNTGVFVGACCTESEKVWFYDKIPADGYGLVGCSRALLANRISYWLGVNGPSYAVDSACSSSLFALDNAYKAIRDGLCEAAIVGGCNLCLHPNVSLQFSLLGVVSNGGRCKSFDESADGFGRAEAVVVLFLQKAKAARRIYARVVHTRINCDGYKEQGINYPSGVMQQQLYEKFYKECEVDPKSLSFIEAHGTGTKAGDPEEVKAIESFFCVGRTSPLKIGTVKSNMGHAEAASGLCSVTKVVLAFEQDRIPPNINLTRPRSDIEAFHNKKITIVTEPCSWDSGPSGVNSFGFGGANCHVLLTSNPKKKINGGLPFDDLPRLVLASGRTKEAVDVILTDLETRPLDAEYVRLLHEVYSDNISAHVYRGYTIVDKNGGSLIKHQEHFPGDKRSIWFVFSGMGSQWPAMGKTLMKIPLFEESIQKSHQILTQKGVDLIRIITTNDANIFGNILHSFVGIAAIQIALVDILRAIDIVPDGIIGHSVGELGCAYADGCITAEQMILAAYYRGLASLETKLIHGSMAAVGVGYNIVRSMVPPEIDIACHNGPENCTISGPSEIVRQFMESLAAKGIFVREVNVSNIPYHSRYIADAGPILLSYLKKVIPEPKLRSNKWISSSNLETDWNTEKAMYSSAEYHTNNLLSSVYFEESSRHIPSNAITIEIAPHGLLQAILKRSNENVINIPLTLRNCQDSTEFLFQSLGKMYEAGVDFKVQMLYPPIEFPVSKGTPMISPLVRWEHTDDWYVMKVNSKDVIQSGERNVVFSLQDKETEYLSGHTLDGRNLYPATGYLFLVWETISLMRSESYSDISVVFEDIRFIRATNIPKKGNVEFMIIVTKGSGYFEIVEGGGVVVTGRISLLENTNKESVDLPSLEDEEDMELLSLNSQDVYKELRLRGYNYKGLFRGITYANNGGTLGRILWANNFVAFMDNMLQMNILSKDTREIFVPTAIRRMVIDTKKHFNILQTLDKNKPEFTLYYYKDIGLTRCGGIDIYGLRASPIAKKKSLEIPVLEKYQFVPYINEKSSYDFPEVIRICTHIVLENVQTVNVRTVELLDSFANIEGPLVSQILADVLNDLPLIQTDIVILGSKEHPLVKEETTRFVVEEEDFPNDQSVLLIVASDILRRKETLGKIFKKLKHNGFLLCREKLGEKLLTNTEGLDICFSYNLQNERLLLVRKSVAMLPELVMIKLSENTFSWLPGIQKHICISDTLNNPKLLLYAEKEPTNGIIGFINCLRKEQHGENIRCFFIFDETAPTFSIHHPLYKSQLAKDLTMNVYKDGAWGSYRHLLLEDSKKVQASHAYVNIMVRGDLTSLRWVEGRLNPFTYQENGKTILVYIYYASLNFKDVMLATGRLSYAEVTQNRLEQDCVQGMEYVGRDINGTRYMGFVQSGSMSTMIESNGHFNWRIPDHWTMEEAATIPIAYGTVLYALFVRGRMKRGESILIHAGSGGVGQAAINICLHYKCEVFTTVGTQQKREFIRKTFPQIPDSHIGNSRDTSFEHLVIRETNGKGVDVVLNSLSEEKLQASVRCLGKKGRFLEIGKFDLIENNSLGMRHFLDNVCFHGVMLEQLFDDEKVERKLQKLLQREIESGAVKPLARTVFTADRVEDAFRYMAAGKHIGKVVLKMRDEETDFNAKPMLILMDALPRYCCDPEKTYIICGGLGGFGLELSDWLIVRGARNLVLTSRTGARNGYQAMRIRIWRSYGVSVVVSTDDITKEEGVKQLLDRSNILGPVDGIFNLATVLRDALLENQTQESFAVSVGPKAIATRYLDRLSRKMCPTLRQFVVFSSVSCGRGNAGQTNYGFSNSVMERICDLRQASGYPGLAIQWGTIGEVGLVADMAKDSSEMVIDGILQQKISSCLETLDCFMKQSNPIVASMVIAEKRLTSGGGKTIVDTVANILALRDLKTVSLNFTLAELGLDSMMVVEIKQILEREYEVFMSPKDIRSLTFNKLREMAASNHTVQKTEAIIKTKEPTTRFKTDFGLRYYMSAIDDELEAAKPIVRIRSLADDGRVEELPVVQTPTVFVFPGIEGSAKMMTSLASNLNMQLLCLQYHYEHDPITIELLAKSLITIIINRLPKTQKFYIIGYSFGGLVALEVVKLLEEEGYTGYLWVLDSAPEFCKTLFSYLFSYDEKKRDEMEVKVILYIMELFSLATKELIEELSKLKDWNSRVDRALSFMPPDGKHNKQYLRSLITAVYRRIEASMGYKACFRNLNTHTVLIRPADISWNTEDDYGLSQYFKSSVQIHFVEGDHLTMLENKEVATIINESCVVVR